VWECTNFGCGNAQILGVVVFLFNVRGKSWIFIYVLCCFQRSRPAKKKAKKDGDADDDGLLDDFEEPPEATPEGGASEAAAAAADPSKKPKR
jgi:hypothetical protein